MSAQTISRTLYIKWASTIIFPLILLLIPTGEVYTVEIKKFLVITLWAILMLMMELIENTATCLIFTFAYALFGVLPLADVLSGWTNSIIWMVYASLVILNVVMHTTLLERIAYFFIIRTGGTYFGILIGIALLDILAALLVPSVITPVATLAIAYGICQTLGLGKGKASAGIMLTTIIAFTEAGNFIYIPSCIGMAGSIVGQVTEVNMDYLTVLKHNWIFIPMLFLLVFVISKLMKPEVPIDSKDVFKEKLASLGKMTGGEKSTLVILVFFLIGLFTNPLHHINMEYFFIAATVLMFFPKIGIGQKNDFVNVNMNTLIFVVSCLSIGAAGGAVGIGQAIADIAYPMLEGSSNFVFSGLIWVIGVICNFFMTPMALQTVLGGPIGEIANSLGITGYPVSYLLYFAGNNLLFPYENTTYLICYSFGLIYMKDFIKVNATKIVICFLYTVIIGTFYWQLIGLF